MRAVHRLAKLSETPRYRLGPFRGSSGRGFAFVRQGRASRGRPTEPPLARCAHLRVGAPRRPRTVTPPPAGSGLRRLSFPLGPSSENLRDPKDCASSCARRMPTGGCYPSPSARSSGFASDLPPSDPPTERVGVACSLGHHRPVVLISQGTSTTIAFVSTTALQGAPLSARRDRGPRTATAASGLARR